MFTQTELNVLQQALRNWKGPYTLVEGQPPLTTHEVERSENMLKIADQLAKRFEEILMESDALIEQRLLSMITCHENYYHFGVNPQ